MATSIVLLATVAGWLATQKRAASKLSGSIRSVAVLPLDNLSADGQQEYFSDGMTDQIIASLSRISALRVISRTSVMQYKRTHKALPAIAKELNVDAIVEGSVIQSNGRVRVSSRLVRAQSESNVWEGSFERDLKDALALQTELALKIAQEIRVTIDPSEQSRLAPSITIDPEVYQLYLKGRFYANTGTEEGLHRAVQTFSKAIERDSNYAAAYAGLADCASSAGWLSFISPEEGCGKGKRLAQKALDMDPNLAEAHTSLAWATVHYDYDFVVSEREYQRSIELNPRDATTHMWFSLLLAATGRFEEGITQCKQAVRLDPLALMVNAGLGLVYMYARRYDQMVDQAKKTLELDPNFLPALYILGAASMLKGVHEPAIAAFQKGVDLSSGGSIYVTGLGWAYAHAGKRDDARIILERSSKLSEHRYVMASMVALIYAAMQEKDEAFRWLETAYRERSVWMVYLNVDPRLDSLRSDPRFQDLMRRMNFPP